MSKILRKTALVFGSGLLAVPNGISQFGSLANGTPNFTIDPAVIQALPAWVNGWGAATVSNFPALEDLNAVDYVNSYQIGYILQQGIPEWDSGTIYFVNSIVQSGGVLYQSLADNNKNNAVSNGAFWINFLASAKGENLFRNSSMLIGQRNYSGTVTAGAPGYTMDGWIVGCTGANISWSVTPNATNMLRLIGAASVTDTFIKQRIESLVMAPYVNTALQTLTFQALVHNNTGGPITPTLAVNSPTAWPDNYAGTVAVLAATNLQTIPSGATQVVSYTFSVASDADVINGLEVILDFGAVLTSGGKYVEVGLFDVSSTPNLSVGLQSNPPVAQVRPLAVEQQFNQRYLQSFGTNRASTAQAIVALGQAVANNSAFFPINLPVPMSKIPSVSLFSSGGGTVGSLELANGGGGPFTLTSLTLDSRSSVSLACLVGGVAGTPLTANTPYFMETDNANDIHILLSTEL